MSNTTVVQSEFAEHHPWKGTVLSALGNYIDASSIVAGASALGVWASYFHMGSGLVGMLGALSSNAISAGVGALIGGRLCDKYGRKTIYSWDLLMYSFGVLWIIFATAPWMLFVGYIIVGLSVGIDIPASWTFIAELAPSNSRGKHSGFAQALWNMGPVITLFLAYVLSGLGILGSRILFAYLLILALITWALRRSLTESALWKEAAKIQETQRVTAPGIKELLASKKNITAIVFLVLMYGLWNLVAGTNGFFLPYILRTVGSQSQATSVLLQCFNFFLTVVFTVLVFMPLNDHVNRRALLGISTMIQVIAFLLFVFFPLNTWTAIANVTLYGIGFGFGQQHFFQLWSSELFPTELRSTAQGFMFAIVRIGLGFWSFFVPILAMTGFQTLALIMTLMLIASGIIGIVFAPKTQGKTLKEIELERGM